MALAAETEPKVTRLAEAARTFQGQNLYIDKPTTFNAPYAGADALMDIAKDTSLGDFTSKELTESSAIQGDFDHASLNYSGQQNIQARAESQDVENVNPDIPAWKQKILEQKHRKRDEADDDYVIMDEAYYNWSQPCDVCDGGKLTQEGDENDLWVIISCDSCEFSQDIKMKEAESFRAYDDAISDRQRYKIQELRGKVDSSMNRSEASDYIKELQGRESGTWKSADTFQADSWDDLYVVAENQMGGWEACDVTDGVLQTYANQADAEREAQMTIEDLNEMYDWDSNPMGLEEGQFNYGENSWAGKRLSEVGVADNVEFIRYPNGLEAPYDEVHQGRSMNDPAIQLNATRGIDTFTEPFEDDDEKNQLAQSLGPCWSGGFGIYVYSQR